MDVRETISIERAELDSPEAARLIRALNEELTGRYREVEAQHFRLDPEEVGPGRGTFLIVRRRGEPVACGAVRLLDASTAELKRMYTVPSSRG